MERETIRRALEHRPDSLSALVNLGPDHSRQEKFAEPVTYSRRQGGT